MLRARVRTEAPRLLRFLLVGGTGFAVDALTLALLNGGLGMDPFSARVLSMCAATVVTWRCNRAYTFGASKRRQSAEGARYAAVAALACAVNYGVYALLLVAWPRVTPLGAVVVATGVAVGVSYLGYSRFVFAAAPPARAANP
jgi:putative flippase GtrA